MSCLFMGNGSAANISGFTAALTPVRLTVFISFPRSCVVTYSIQINLNWLINTYAHISKGY